MAYQSAHAVNYTDIPHRAFDAVKSFFAAIGKALVAASEGNRRLQLVEKLSAKSDQELADMGIRREDIVRRVFIDMLDV